VYGSPKEKYSVLIHWVPDLLGTVSVSAHSVPGLCFACLISSE